ncbi:MAG: flagellar basal body rod protein FlgB [Bacillota bacterium]|jgi:flagellar basal-body rod protein FlgB|nr:flagellar basal body rod protein FlgB [Clostridia bacterium]
MTVNDPVLNLIFKGLDAASLRQRTIAHNLANINTPGFKRSLVSFEEKLDQSILRQTDRHHYSYLGARDIEPQVIKTGAGTQRQDENNVNLDIELSAMIINTIRYNALIQQASDRLENLRYVINDGRR